MLRQTHKEQRQMNEEQIAEQIANETESNNRMQKIAREIGQASRRSRARYAKTGRLWEDFEQAWNDETAPIDTCEKIGEIIDQLENKSIMKIYIYANGNQITAEYINRNGKTIASITGDETTVRKQIEKWQALRNDIVILNSYGQ